MRSIDPGATAWASSFISATTIAADPSAFGRHPVQPCDPLPQIKDLPVLCDEFFGVVDCTNERLNEPELGLFSSLARSDLAADGNAEKRSKRA